MRSVGDRSATTRDAAAPSSFPPPPPRRFADHFSAQAAGYRDFRPRYPDALFDHLAALAPSRRLAWDCATGNGQAAAGLVGRFEQVIATDASEAQLRHAEPHPRITYRHAHAEASGLEAMSVDLVTVAQALHWLDHAAFFAEVRRVLRPGGVIAVWGYDLIRVSPPIDAVIDDLYHRVLRDDWAPERRILDDHFRAVRFPFHELPPPTFAMEARWTRSHFLGYLRTWSATRRHVERTGHDPVLDVERAIAPYWRDPEEERMVRWELFMRVGQQLAASS